MKPVEIRPNFIRREDFEKLPEYLPDQVGRAVSSYAEEVTIAIAHGIFEGKKYEVHVVITKDEDEFIVG